MRMMSSRQFLGFADTYDFVYTPCRKRGTKSMTQHANMGYAFENVKTSQYAEHFAMVIANVQFTVSNSSKRCFVKVCSSRGLQWYRQLSTKSSANGATAVKAG